MCLKISQHITCTSLYHIENCILEIFMDLSSRLQRIVVNLPILLWRVFRMKLRKCGSLLFKNQSYTAKPNNIV